MSKISPHAVIEPGAVIAPDAEIGPFCVVGAHVVVGAGTRLINSVTLMGRATLGAGNVLYPGVVVGGPPQDKKYRGALTEVIIGDNNTLREHVTIHAGSEKGGGVTRIGSGNYLMACSHVGHDAAMGNNCVLANNVMIAGHVICGDGVNIMGGAGVHHFVTIGEYSFIGGCSRIHHDVPPFTKVDGADRVRGVNDVGLRRAGFSEQDIDDMDLAVRDFFLRDKPMALTMNEYGQRIRNGASPYIRRLVEFLQQRDKGRHGRFQESKRR